MSELTAVLVTAPDLEEARHLVGVLLDQKLIACANLLPGVESHFTWNDRREQSTEVLLLLKTHPDRLEALRDLLLAQHSYDCPEILALPADSLNDRYTDWVTTCVGL
jgi:periplasmic divalent cation tolerance protein